MAFEILRTKLMRGILGIVDMGSSYELVPLKRKGFILEEQNRKSKRLWLLLHKSHIKYSPQLRMFVVYLSGERAITSSPELLELIKKAWKDGIRHQQQLMSEFVEEWAKDEDGNLIPVKFKDEIQFAGTSISAEQVSEVIKTFDPQLLYSYIENEVSARIRLRTYGIEVKTFITVFIAVLLAIIIAWVVIKSNAVDVHAIANAVKGMISKAPQPPANATVSPI